MYTLALEVVGTHIRAFINAVPVFDVHDVHRPLMQGGVALICEEGCLSADFVRVQPAASR